MLKYYWWLLGSVPKLLLDATDRLSNIFTLVTLLVLTLLALLSRPAAGWLNQPWLNVDPWVIAFLLFLMVIFAVAKANFQHVDALASANRLLEQRLEPSLTADLKVHINHGAGVAALVLEVSNAGIEPIRGCTVRISRLLWDMSDDERPMYHDELQGKDHYLRWNLDGASRVHSFQSSATLTVVRGRGGNSRYQVETLNPAGLSVGTSWHYLELEATAENSAPIHLRHRFRIGSFARSWSDLGAPGEPPDIDFEEIRNIPDGPLY